MEDDDEEDQAAETNSSSVLNCVESEGSGERENALVSPSPYENHAMIYQDRLRTNAIKTHHKKGHIFFTYTQTAHRLHCPLLR